MLSAALQALIFLSFLSGATIIGLYLLAYCAHCILVVVQGTSAGADHVTWPDEGVLDWVGSSLGLVALALIWMIPAGIAANAIDPAWLDGDRGLRTLFVAVPVLWLFFPIGALSSLSSVSRWVFFRPLILGRLLRVFPSWMFFYISTAAVAVLGTVPFYLAVFKDVMQLLLLAAPVTAAMVLVYARLLGRLGLLIRQLGPLPGKKANKPGARLPRSLRKQIQVNDPWAVPAIPEPPLRPTEEKELSAEEAEADVTRPYGVADAHVPPPLEIAQRPQRVRPLDEEELDALKGFGVADLPSAPKESVPVEPDKLVQRQRLRHAARNRSWPGRC